MHPKARLLRSQLSSNVLGGMQLDDFISEEELEALEACVAAPLLVATSEFPNTRSTAGRSAKIQA